MKCIFLTCVLAVLAPLSQASTITVTITGTFAAGSVDHTGVFYPGFLNTPIGGDPFSLVFSFDDSLGLDWGNSVQSYVEYSGSSSPGTAALTDTASGASTTPFTFGSGTGNVSKAYSMTASGGSYYVWAGDGSLGNGSDVIFTITPPSGTLGNVADYRASFGPTTTASASSTTFQITEGYETTAYVTGSLTPSSIITIGPPNLAGITGSLLPPISETTTFHAWDSTYPTNADFNQSLNPLGGGSSSAYNGASIYETVGVTTGSDACYSTFVANNVAGTQPLYSPWNQIVQRGATTVASGVYTDRIGWDTGHISYYRSPGGTLQPATLPCHNTLYQTMTIEGTDSNYYSYGLTNSGNQNVLKATISSTTLQVSRATVNSSVLTYP